MIKKQTIVEVRKNDIILMNFVGETYKVNKPEFEVQVKDVVSVNTNNWKIIEVLYNQNDFKAQENQEELERQREESFAMDGCY